MKPGLSYTQLKKTEDLAKAPFVTDEEKIDNIGTAFHYQPERHGDYFKHHASEALPDGLYHHTFKTGAGTTIHAISRSSSPRDPSVAHIHGKVKGGAFHILESKANPHFAGMGYGKRAYAEALKAHGKMVSDKMTSANADKAWNSLSSIPGASVQMGHKGQPDHHVATYTPMRKTQTLGHLNKEDFGSGNNPMHGLISPEGKYHPLDRKKIHEFALDDKSKMHSHEAYAKGWLTVGHAGAAHHSGSALKDRNHPATRTLRHMMAQHHTEDAVYLTPHNNDPGSDEYDRKPIKADAQAFIRHGVIKPYLGKSLEAGQSYRDLFKGAKGDWKKEGYEIKHEMNDGNVVVTAHKDGKKVAELEAAHSQGQPGKLYPLNVKVDEAHRRKGIATEMYRRAEHVLGKPMGTGNYQSDEAKAFRASRSKK